MKNPKEDSISETSWKLSEYGKPRTTLGLVSLFWKEYEYEDSKGKTINAQDYIFSEDYQPEFTFGMITRDEILAVLKRLKKCPEYALYPEKIKSQQKTSKIMILFSFLIFILSWVLLAVLKSQKKIYIFCGVCFIFVLTFCFACCQFSNSRSEFRRYLAYRDIYFDEVLKDCNKIFSKRGVKFYYNNFSKFRDIIVRIRKPELMKRKEGETFERHYLGFESIIKNAEEVAKKKGVESVKGVDKLIAEKNVYGNFVADEVLRTRMILEEMKENNVKDLEGGGKKRGVGREIRGEEDKENIDTDRRPINVDDEE